jgi:hypothetical protein
MRYKRNPYEGLREYDAEHRELLARLRAAADTLKSFNVLDPRDPKFQALLPEAALNWPNRELRQVVEKAESDVKFYADFFQKRNPKKRRRNPEEYKVIPRAWGVDVYKDGQRIAVVERGAVMYGTQTINYTPIGGYKLKQRDGKINLPKHVLSDIKAALGV